LILLSVMRQHVHIMGHLKFEFVEFLISLFNLLIQGLILNLELLIINQMQTISQLLSLSQLLLLVGKLISQSDVLQSILIDLLIFSFICFFPFLNHLWWKLLTSSTVLSIHGNTLLELFELLLNLHTFLLLFIKLILEFTCHSVISFLSLFKVVTNLMYICKSIEILVLMKHLICLLFRLLACVLHQYNFLLEFFVLTLQFIVLMHLIMDSLNKFSLHNRL